MKKNVAGQTIGAQMVASATGAAFTSAVTVYVTGDAGTQGAGSVGSGACTHEGNGYHTYAPAQAETNYDLIAFTFIGTGAVPATVQVYTDFSQTGDAFSRLGAPAGASVSADIASIKSDTAATLTAVDTEVAAILAAVDTEIGAIKTVTDTLSLTAIADAVLKRDWTSVTGEAARSVLNALRAIRNKVDMVSTPGSVLVKKEDDSTNAWTAVLTTDPAAEPITSVDPT